MLRYKKGASGIGPIQHGSVWSSLYLPRKENKREVRGEKTSKSHLPTEDRRILDSLRWSAVLPLDALAVGGAGVCQGNSKKGEMERGGRGVFFPPIEVAKVQVIPVELRMETRVTAFRTPRGGKSRVEES